MPHSPPMRFDAPPAAPRRWLCPALASGVILLSACASPSVAAGPAPVYYFSDCQSGAAADCTPGKNSNAGTRPTAPKQNLNGFDVNSLPAGAQLLFARGGAWNWSMLRLENLNATPAAPLALGDYGSGALPLLRLAQGTAFEIGGGWNNTNNDGGYTLRNLKLDGQGTGQWGFWLRDNVRAVTFDGVEITGFAIGLHVQSLPPHGVTALTIRNSTISRNHDMGMLAKASGLLMEDNTFEGNNFTGSAFSHAVYLSGGNKNVVRNNRFINNSAVGGVCKGGNFTVHGQVDGLLIEGNTITQAAAAGSCYGFSITPGYTSAEWFRNVVLRGNTIINVGGCAVCAGAAPGIVVTGNTIINTQNNYQVGVLIPTGVEAGSEVSAGDDVDAGAVVRDNTVCFAAPHKDSSGVRVSGAGAQVANNAVRTGNAAASGACAR